MNIRGRVLPEPGTPAGYAALILRHDLRVPPPPRLTAIAERHRPSSTREWRMLPPGRAPDESLQGQLEFALKWEGVSLGVLLALFRKIDSVEVVRMVSETPTGVYARRIWFLYEWLMDACLDLPDGDKVKAVPVLNPKQQFAPESGPLSRRHRVRNNLPGTRRFCPLVRRTPELDRHVEMRLDEKAREVIGRTRPDIVGRAAAFLLLEDSRASFQIEGERPPQDRALRWGQAIGAAGLRDLTLDELVRLQQTVIGDSRFVQLGLRTEGGWIGERDRQTQDPIPAHVSARAGDLPELMKGVVEYARGTEEMSVDPVVVAAALSFGFVYIHPFEDGNGRLHRWLVHHVLARAGYNPPNLVFPVSVPMLRRIAEYREVLSSYSAQVLPLVEWRPTRRGNVEVLNETVDYYRFFDATEQAEFLYACVAETVTRDLPGEVEYLEAYDDFSRLVQEQVADMPERTIALLTTFLRQNRGTLSKRARSREFRRLSPDEVGRVEGLYAQCFRS
ncbi:Fic family protein [Candidatus Palauibacter sp.]|uniref:Fic family protein n=1 Tax=Candidatus Palauibacter sp. TaxID=3101350 RepID=UPI003B01768D